MDLGKLTIDAATLIPVLVAVLGPTILGFLQQLSAKVAKMSFIPKLILSALISAVTAVITAYIASGDALLATVGGVIVGTFGSLNIYFRKGTRGNLEVSLKAEQEVANG